MKQQFVKDLKNGDQTNDVFVINKISNPIPYKGKSGSWISMEVSDKTGIIEAKFWGDDTNSEDSNTLYSSLKVGDVVEIVGNLESYQGNPPAISIKPGSITKKNGEFDPGDFIAKTEKDIDAMIVELKSVVATITNSDIKRLVNAFVEDGEFMKKFSSVPAAKKLHHAKIGGLLEHVISLLAISLKVAEKHPGLDKDYLIAGCIFHDIGKAIEYKVTTLIDITKEGRMLGHISIGQKMVNDKIDELGDIPEEIRLKIIHIILSHHGELKNGSPIKPCFPEAVAFSKIDDADAQIQRVIDVKNNANQDEEWMWVTDFRDGEWHYLK